MSSPPQKPRIREDGLWLRRFRINGRPDLDLTADRRSVGTGIAAMPEEGSGILSGDAVERGSQRLLQRLDGARGDPAKVGFHLGPARLDRAEVRAVAGQVAIGKAGSIEHRLHLR